MLDRGVWYRDAAGTGNLPGAATRRGGLDLFRELTATTEADFIA